MNSLHHPDEKAIPSQRLTDNADNVNENLLAGAGEERGAKSSRVIDEPESDQQTLIQNR